MQDGIPFPYISQLCVKAIVNLFFVFLILGSIFLIQATTTRSPSRVPGRHQRRSTATAAKQSSVWRWNTPDYHMSPNYRLTSSSKQKELHKKPS